MSFSLDDPPNSRLFVVAGRNTSAEFLRGVFEQYGGVAFVKYLRDKGVAYVKYDRASSAALAIENLHEVTLNDGLGPRLKVMLAESPHTRSLPGLHVRRPEEEIPLDPDNTPPRSRLFMVVPKNADGSVIEAEMSRFGGMQYCKTDLVASKGIVFVKYAASSTACMAMEMVQQAGSVAGYKVKIMLAEPKSRRVDSGGGMPGFGGSRGGGGGMQQGLLPPGMGVPGGFAGGAPSAQLLSSLVGPNGMHLQDFSSLQSAVNSLGGGFAGGRAGGLRASGAPSLDASDLSHQGSLGCGDSGGFPALGGLGGEYDYMNLGAFGGLGLASPMLGGGGLMGGHNSLAQQHQQQCATSGRGLSNTRLFIVVHKGTSEEALAHVFRCYPGMEYLDLKRDRSTGRSKGYAYVNYSTPEAAAAAQDQLNGVEYPPGLGCKLKVLFAEPLGSGMPSMPSVPSMGSLDSMGCPHSDDRLVGGEDPSPVGATLLGTPSQEAASTGFRLSPSSGDSAGQGAAFGQLSDPNSSTSRDTTRLSAHSSPLRLGHGHGGGEGGMGSLLDPSAADLAAMQHTLAGMVLGLPTDPVANGHAHAGGLGSAHLHGSPLSAGRLSSGVSDRGPGSWREPSPDHLLAAASSAAASPAKALPMSCGDATVVYSALPRPLPDYALSHVFARCGPVEYVRVLPDERVALVKYATADAAALAVGSLNGVEVLGEVLQVRHSPPPHAVANSGGFGALQVP